MPVVEETMQKMVAMTMEELTLLFNFWCGGDWWQTTVVDYPLAGEVADRETPWACGP